MSVNEGVIQNAFYRETKEGMLRDKFPHRFFDPSLRKKRIKAFIEIMCIDMEGKSVEEVYHSLSNEIIEKYGLDRLSKFVPDYTQKSRIEIVRTLFRMGFPHLPEKTPSEITIEIYEELLSGERKQFPNHFFSQNAGTERSIIIYRYVFENKLKLDPSTQSMIKQSDYIKYRLDKINSNPQEYHRIAYFL